MRKRYLGQAEPELQISRGALYAWQRQKDGSARMARFYLAISGDEAVLEDVAFAGGRLLGRLEALRAALSWLLEYRFGQAPVAKRLRQLAEIDDPRVLERYFAKALRCRTLAEFLGFEVLR